MDIKQFYQRVLESCRAIPTDDIGIRAEMELEPFNKNNRIFPPSYNADQNDRNRRDHNYSARFGAEEGLVKTVVVDQIQACAHKLKESLILAKKMGIKIPEIYVEYNDKSRIGSLELSHGVFDAYLAQSEFFKSPDYKELGKAASDIDVAKALRYLARRFPTTTLFGGWHSHSDLSSHIKIARCVACLIEADVYAESQYASSRIDKYTVGGGLMAKSTDPKRPITSIELAKVAKEKGAKKLSEFGLGSIAPSLSIGGSVVGRIREEVTFSPRWVVEACPNDQGKLEDPQTDASRALILCMGLLSYVIRTEMLEIAYALRSGCELVPKARPTYSWVRRFGQPPDVFQITVEEAKLLFQFAAEQDHFVELDRDEAFKAKDILEKLREPKIKKEKEKE